jgi:hypothetical protein
MIGNGGHEASTPFRYGWLIAYGLVVVTSLVRAIAFPATGADWFWIGLSAVVVTWTLMWLLLVTVSLPLRAGIAHVSRHEGVDHVLLVSELKPTKSTGSTDILAVDLTLKKTLPKIATLDEEQVRFWTGTRAPVLIEEFSRSLIKSVRVREYFNGIQRVSAIELFNAQQGFLASFVPTHVLGRPLSRRRVLQVRATLEAWAIGV